MSNLHTGVLEIPLDAQTATFSRSNACLAHEVVALASGRLVIFSHGRELLAPADGHEISFHVPLSSTVGEVSLRCEVETDPDAMQLAMEAHHVHP